MSDPESKPRFIVHVCDRDHLYIVCECVADQIDPVYKTIAECPSIRWARIFIDAARASAAPREKPVGV